MKLVNITKLCNIEIGKTPSRNEMTYWGTGVNWVSIRDMKEKYILDTKEEITTKAISETGIKIVPKNTVIMSFKLSVGKVAIVGKDMYTNEAIAAFHILDESKLYNKYLYYALQTLRLTDNTDRAVMGLTLNKQKLKQISIPVPTLETQKKIVEVLDKAQGLIDARKEQIRLMDELIQSVFYEMFGDPVTNPKGWEVVKMSSLGSFKNGMNYSSSDSGVSLNCLGVGDFKSLYKIEQTEVLPMISLNQIPSEDYMLKNKDIVFVRSNGNKALVGRSVIVFPDNNKVTFSGFCIRLRVISDTIHEKFLIQLLRSTSVKNKLLSNGRGANISNLNQKMLSDVDVILPPKELQIRFIEIVEKIENQKKYMELSLSEHEMSFQSIVKASF